METTPRRSFAATSANPSTATSRFHGLGGAPPNGPFDEPPMSASARAAARTDDELHFKRWKETVRVQDEEQTRLHQTVVASKRQQLDAQHERLAKQRAFIRHEKRKILLQNAVLESEKERFEASLTSDWFCLTAFPSVHDRRVTLNVGGQLFEISTPVLLKDPNSMLAAFVADDSPLSAVECGCFRVDRDWWLFRYALCFLRDGMLPQDPKLLRELYLESEFWKLDSLRRAIEMKNMELLQIKQQNDAETATAAAAAATLLSSHNGQSHAKFQLDSALVGKMKVSAAMTPEHHKRGGAHAWWLEAPTWWGAADGKKEPKLALLAATAMKHAQLEKLKKSKRDDAEIDAWWKATTYKGHDFTQPLAGGNKTKMDQDDSSGSGTQRSPLMLSSTWQSSHR